LLQSNATSSSVLTQVVSCATAGDGRTAADARLFLLGFLKRFPQYAASEFYISGESYGEAAAVFKCVLVCLVLCVGGEGVCVQRFSQYVASKFTSAGRATVGH
jgi:hypothetical protein